MSALRFTLVVLFLSTVSVQAQYSAMPDPRSALSAELITGTVGGAGFGLAGAYLAAMVCSAQTEGWEGLACIGAAALGYLIGVPVGSTVGVSVAGALSGVQGNLLLSALGAIGGEAAGIGLGGLMTAALDGLPESVSVAMFLGVIPFLSSTGATLGYNIGAQMVSQSSEEFVPIP